MPTAYSTLLGLALPVQGELSGTWGDTVNNYITNYLDSAIAGAATVSYDGDVTLSKTTGTALTSAVSGSTGSSQFPILNCTGARTALRTITVPAASKTYIVINATTGGYDVKLVGSGPTTGVTITNGTRAVVAWNGSDFVVLSVVNSSGAVPLVNGGTGATTASAAQAALQVPSITIDQNSTAQIIGSVSGTDTITGSLSPAITSYVAGQTFRFVAAGANTGPVTINLNGLGAKDITKTGTTALGAGDIASGAAIQIVYDGTRFQLTSGAGGGATAGGIFYENNTTLASNYTLTTGKNAMMTGPLTINSGVTLTIPTGQRLVVL